MKNNKIKTKLKQKIIILTLASLLVLSACSKFTIKEKDNNDDLAQIDDNVSNGDKSDTEDTQNNKDNENSDSNIDKNENKDDEDNTNVVETFLDKDNIITNQDSIEVVVNKKRNLSDDYVPGDLISIIVPTCLESKEVNQLREVASDALVDMFDKAKEEINIQLYARSGYRSYDTQVSLYNGYVKNHGQEAADKFSAKPGQSEHQTGLSMDITSDSVNLQLSEDFGDTKEGKWVAENAYRFGFIVRYPKEKEDITGYIYEPWHVRYVGTDLAKEVYESGLTLEEYLFQQ